MLAMIVKNTEQMSHPGSVIDARQDNTNETPFHTAIRYGKTEAAVALADAGADVDAQFNVNSPHDHAGHYTALTYAASLGMTEMVECLIDRCAADASLLSPLRCALEGGHTSTVLSLIDRASELDEEEDDDNPLHIAAYHGHGLTVLALLKLGVAVDGTTWMGKTALMVCVEQDNIDIAQLLLKNGATLRASDDHGRTALHYCCRDEDEDPDDDDFDNTYDIDIDDPPEGHTALAIELIEHAKKRSALCCRMNCRQMSPPYLTYTFNGEHAESFNSTGRDQHSSFCSEACKEAATESELSASVHGCEFIDMQDSRDDCRNTALHAAVLRGK